MTEIYWPGTDIAKSQNNAFTAHLRSSLPTVRVAPEDTKACKRCGQLKPMSLFEKHVNTCKTCRYERQRELKSNPPFMGAYSRA